MDLSVGGVKSLLVTEWGKLASGINSYRTVKPGLYTYRITMSNGYKKRLHLRVEADQRGILFVDVTDVLHLNKSATEIIKLLLDDIPVNAIKNILAHKYGLLMKSLKQDVNKLSLVVEHLTKHGDGCNTCDIGHLVQMQPLFSVPVNAPYKVDIALTYGCNNQCPHCYNEVNRLTMPSLPLEIWKVVIDKLAHLGTPHIILTGGEATLHPDFIEIVRYADSLGMIVGLNSNGRYLSHEPFNLDAVEAGLNHVQITIGSCYPEVHNEMMGAKSFEQTVKGIQTAIASGIHVITNTTIMRSNIKHLDELVDFLYNLGIKTFAMNGMIYSGGGFEHPNAIDVCELASALEYVRELADEKGMRFLWYTPTEYCHFSPVEFDLGTKKCNAGEYSMCIEPNGDVLPCQSYYVSAGNIVEDSWEKIWNSELFQSFRMREEKPAEFELEEKCWRCPDLSICGAGCRIEREAKVGIRVADLAGGGCVGCSGFTGGTTGNPGDRLSEHAYKYFIEGFIPNPSQVKKTLRSSGNLPLIAIEGHKKEKDFDDC